MENTTKNPFDSVPGSHGCIITQLEPGEIPLLVVRKHWVTLVEVYTLLVIVIGLGVSTIFIATFAQIPGVFNVLTAIAIIMIGIQYVFIRWLNVELDILVVTNKRIIEYDQVKFLDRKISQASIDQVQEVQASTSGLLGNILRYGAITVKTAGDASDFVLTKIPHALETSRIIHSLIDQYRHALGERRTDFIPSNNDTTT